MELREMRAFIAIVEAGSFSAAARRLGVSQSALSQTVSALERRLDKQLLVRTRSGTSVTGAGSTLLEEARGVIARHDQALTALARHSDDDIDVLRLGLPLELPPDLLKKPLEAVAAGFPATEVRTHPVSPAVQEAALRAGEMEVGLLHGRPAGDELDCLLIREEPLGVLLNARGAARLSGPDGVALEALAGLDWAAFPRRDAPGYHDELTAVLRNHGLDVAGTVEDVRILVPEVKFALVDSGRAFALAPAHVARTVPETLAWCPLAGHPVIRRTWAAWPASCHRRDVGHFIAAFDLPERRACGVAGDLRWCH
ncbi:MAG TPA: LysR family transcriptional regulator [Actinocrinis sp.]|nr:LysR family transcriptional regulator [Actinocrinis sp.]